MIKLKFIVSSIIVVFLSSCGVLDREKEVDITTDLEAIPQEEIAQEPSIFIDDEEMMPEDVTTFSDDGTLTREDQISAEPSGTF